MSGRREYISCAACGKNGYKSRKDARRAAKALHPDQSLHAYECPNGTGLWHLGHLPYAVVNRGADRATAAVAPRRRR